MACSFWYTFILLLPYFLWCKENVKEVLAKTGLDFEQAKTIAMSESLGGLPAIYEILFRAIHKQERKRRVRNLIYRAFCKYSATVLKFRFQGQKNYQ